MCTNPLTAYQLNAGGKLIFNSNSKALAKGDYKQLTVPCSKCLDCKLKKAKDWSVRCYHENLLHKQSMFITLTYNDENLPDDRDLRLADFQAFMKRLRQYIYRTTGKKIRFLHVGEYGERTKRPHYHALIFGFNFDDKKLFKANRRGDHLYTSKTLARLWGKGFCLIGSVSQQSASYVARYTLKKTKNDLDYIDSTTGCIKRKEYITMSRRPGIGHDYITKNITDYYPKDYCVINNIRFSAPKYYDKILSLTDPFLYVKVKENREMYFAMQQAITVEQLQVKSQILQARVDKYLIRALE